MKIYTKKTFDFDLTNNDSRFVSKFNKDKSISTVMSGEFNRKINIPNNIERKEL